MKTLIRSSVLLLSLALAGFTLHAQQTPPPPPAKVQSPDKSSENIIIRKSGDSKEKLTIVVDGDKITVNGKPVDQYKGDNIQIMRSDDFGDMGMPAMAPMYKMDMMGGDFMKEMHGNRAFLGVMTEKTDDGAKITEVTKESAAEKAGFKTGDIITKIGEDKIASPDDLYKAVGKHSPDDKVNITYKRDGKEATASTTLGRNTETHVYNYNWNKDGKDFHYKVSPWGSGDMNGFGWDNKPRMGLQVQDTEDGKGVKILDVDDDDVPAAKAGLKENDIITQVNGKAINSVDDLKTTMKDAKQGDSYKVTYLRDGKTQTADVKFPKDLKTTDL